MRKIFVLLISLLVIITLTACKKYSDKSESGTLKSLDSLLRPVADQAFNELNVPGAIVGVFMNGHEAFIQSLGTGELSENKPITANDKMRIGSITKTFTGTVLMQLVGEGKISLEDKLSKFFPDYPNGKNITIQQLADMRSGIFNYTEDTAFNDLLMKDLKRNFTPQELLDVALKHPPYFPPGTSFHYSNTNTIYLGLIIEKITGNTLQSEIKKRVFDPLGMNDSYFAVSTDFPSPHPRGYSYTDTSSSVPTDVTEQDPDFAWSAGAIISTLSDLNKYIKPLATGELIGEKLQKMRDDWKTSMVFPDGQWKGHDLKYGVCIATIGGGIGHNGEIPGFNSIALYMPEKDASVIVLANMDANKKGITPADYIAMKIMDKLNNEH